MPLFSMASGFALGWGIVAACLGQYEKGIACSLIALVFALYWLASVLEARP